MYVDLLLQWVAKKPLKNYPNRLLTAVQSMQGGCVPTKGYKCSVLQEAFVQGKCFKEKRGKNLTEVVPLLLPIISLSFFLVAVLLQCQGSNKGAHTGRARAPGNRMPRF